MGTTGRIPSEQLSTYFDSYTKRFLRDASPEAVSIEVINAASGAQQPIHGARLNGITYERGKNTLDFELDSGDHYVVSPREVWTIEDKDGFVSEIQVVRDDGQQEIVSVERVGLSEI